MSRAIAQVSIVYLNYFGLSEASFSITPDPQYLFLSEQHREALAHLLYGAGENGGFVLLTGEVGTGKTTICRAFLEQTPEQVEVALVLNPAMTAIELMHAICQEFGVETPADNDSVKGLVDRLNRFLLDAHARGRHPVLMIDEAQNLCPRVLEQVRLLTNLETSKHKLLQIFLIGQPELRETLATPELRQLNQRITARFHLSPLSARETVAYVEHRLAVAGVERPLFTPAALREVNRCTQGVPRLINLVCDRALLGAAVTRQMLVSTRIVRRAARELLGDQPRARTLAQRPQLLGAAASGVFALAFGAWLGTNGFVDGALRQVDRTRQLWTALKEPQQTPEALAASGSEPGRKRAPNDDADGPSAAMAVGTADKVLSAGAEEPTTVGVPAGANDEGAGAPLSSGRVVAESESGEADDTAPASSTERDEATPRVALARVAPRVPEVAVAELPELTLDDGEPVSALMHSWGYEVEEGLGCDGLSNFSLGCERAQARWSDLRLFDRPVALRLVVEDQERYALITALDEEFALLKRGDNSGRVPIATLDERWSGDLLMLWRVPPHGVRLIGPGTAGEAVLWLREQLAALPDGVLTDVTSPSYDDGLRKAVRAFQAGRGLVADGIAGPRTLMMLNNALSDRTTPRLSQSQGR
ncbi:MAG: AAA family ATPase [Gammaproteobacteria bacterium]|nr:AAA family ATPase [Gammaproteobacteria bacterium]